MWDQHYYKHSMKTNMYTMRMPMLTGSKLVRVPICELLALLFLELMYSSLLVVRETLTDEEPEKQVKINKGKGR